MNNKLSIQDLASAMSARYGMDTKSANAFVKTVFEIVEEYISTDKLVKIKGWGTFKLIAVSDRESVNVNTGERIVIAGHSKLSFIPDASLKDAVNRPFSDFETTVLNESTSTEDMERIPMDDVEENAVASIQEEIVENEEYVDDVASVKEIVVVNETDTIEEPDTAEKSVTAGESAVVDEFSSEDNAYPMALESIPEIVDKKRSFHFWLYTIFALLMMVLSYIGGYYRIHNKLEIILTPEIELMETNIVVPSLANDTTQLDTAAVDTTTNVMDSVAAQPQKTIVYAEEPEKLARYYPQVVRGEYWIVGDAGRVHLMDIGETLYSIAHQELGSRDLVRYLIVFNDFEDPNVIHKGDTIRIPKLVKK